MSTTTIWQPGDHVEVLPRHRSKKRDVARERDVDSYYPVHHVKSARVVLGDVDPLNSRWVINALCDADLSDPIRFGDARRTLARVTCLACRQRLIGRIFES